MTSRQNKARSKKKTTADAAVFAVMRRAKQCRLCAICRQTTVTRALRSARGCNMNRHAEYSWRSHVHRTRLRSACSPSSIEIAMSGVEGEGPSSFLSGVAKGDTLFREREYPPLSVQRQALLSPRHQCRSFLCTCAKKRKRKQKAPAGRGEGFLLCCVCIFRREKITSGGAPLCKY